MSLEVDHAFIACTRGAPEADALLRHGLVEGSANVHPGQGTANRRFFFVDFMLELLWLADAEEARSERTRRTRLWERCSPQLWPEVNRFGILFRTKTAVPARAPFGTWTYTPGYLPAGLAIEVAEDTTLQEPELFHLPFLCGKRGPTLEPVQHLPTFGSLLGLSVGVPRLSALSAASRAAQRHGLLTYFESCDHVLEICFEGSSSARLDLRPILPLVLCTAPEPRASGAASHDG